MAAPSSAKVIAQGIPNSSVPIVDAQGYVTQAWRYFFGNILGANASQVVISYADRSALQSAQVPAGVDRIYSRFYKEGNEALNPDIPAPHISGCWMRKHTISAKGTLTQRNALGWGNQQNGQYFLQTDVMPNLVWWWLSDPNSTRGPLWYEAGHIGYAWTISADGSYWQVDEVEPNALQMGALNTNTMFGQDDTIPLTDLCYFFAMGRNVFVPGGYYEIKSSLTLKTLGHNTFRGESSDVSDNGSATWIIGGNFHGIIISEVANTQGFHANLEHFVISVNNGDGIHSNLTVEHGIRTCVWTNVAAFGNGYGMYIPYAYSFTMVNCIGFSWSTGHGVALSGGPGTNLIECQGGSSGSGTAVFRVGGHVNFYGCNPVFTVGSSGRAPYAYLLGSYASVSSTAQAGGSNTITLNAGSTFVTDQIVGRDIALTSGTGSGQTGRITAYNSGTKVATVSTNWSVNPDNTTHYTIQDPVPFLQNAPSEVPEATLIGCNAETFTKTGLRTVGDVRMTVIGCKFIGRAGYESSIRLAPDGGASQYMFANLSFFTTGSASNELMSEGVPKLVSYAAITYYNVVSGNVEAFGVGTSTTVGNLPSASSVLPGTRGFVTDSNSTTFHATVAGGGANKVPVVSDGSNWLIG